MFTTLPVLHRESVDSTMTWIHRELESERYPAGLLCRSDHQESGRGRVAGRRWLDRPGESLLASIALPIDVVSRRTVHASTTASLAAGLAVAQTVEMYVDGVVTIKWPNDILVNGRKIAGLILERTARWLLLGIGINIGQRSFPEEISDRATSIAMERRTSLRNDVSHPDEAPSPEDIVRPLLSNLDAAFLDPKWLEKVSARLHMKGGIVPFVSSEFEGVARGTVAAIGSDGALLVHGLQLQDGSVLPEWRCYSGEIVAEGGENR